MSETFGEGGSPQEIIRLQMQAEGGEAAAADIQKPTAALEELSAAATSATKAATAATTGLKNLTSAAAAAARATGAGAAKMSDGSFILHKWRMEADAAAVAAGRLAASQAVLGRETAANASAAADFRSSQFRAIEANQYARENIAKLKTAGWEWNQGLKAIEKTTAAVTKRTFLMNQALFVARRYLFYAALGLTAVAAAGIKWGYDYLVNVKQAHVALGFFIKDQNRLNQAVNQIFELAAKTPFSFDQAIDSVRKLMVVGGASFKQAFQTTKDIANFLSAAGKFNNQALQRANVQIAHMLAIGRVTGQILNNLSRDSIPLGRALAWQYHMTEQQLRYFVSRGAVPAADALKALTGYLGSQGLTGAAEKLNREVLPLLWTSFRDYFGKFAAIAERPLFAGLTNRLQRLVDLLGQANKVGDKGGLRAALNVIDRAGHFGGTLTSSLYNLGHVLQGVWNVFVKGFIPALIGFLKVTSLFGPLKTLAFLLGLAAKHTTLLRIYFGLLITRFAVLHLRALLMVNLWKRLVFWQEAEAVVTNRQTIATTIATVWRTRSLKVLLDLVRVERVLTEAQIAEGVSAYKYNGIIAKTIRFVGRMVELTKALWIWTKRQTLANIIETTSEYVRTAATKAWTVVMWGAFAAQQAFNYAVYENPYVLLAAAIIAVTAALTVLYFKWQPFHNLVNNTFEFIKKNWRWMQYLLPPLKIVIGIYDAVKGIYDIIKKIVDIIKHPLDWKRWLNLTGFGGKGSFEDKLKNFGKGLIPGYNILKKLGIPLPFGAVGGRMPWTGPALVGERGPEIVNLPINATVIPFPMPKSGITKPTILPFSTNVRHMKPDTPKVIVKEIAPRLLTKTVVNNIRQMMPKTIIKEIASRPLTKTIMKESTTKSEIKSIVKEIGRPIMVAAPTPQTVTAQALQSAMTKSVVPPSNQPVVIQVMLDGKKVAEKVAEIKMDKAAGL